MTHKAMDSKKAVIATVAFTYRNTTSYSIEIYAYMYIIHSQ